jgi:hypothetical protein
MCYWMEELQKRLRFHSPKLASNTLRMANETITKPIGLIKDLKIHIPKILYIATFTIMKNNVLDSSYSMLLGKHGCVMHVLFMFGGTT